MTPAPTAVFRSFDPTGRGWADLSFSCPSNIRKTSRLEDVQGIVQAAEQAATDGRWVVMALAYEAAPAFDPALKTHPAPAVPLIWMAEFARPDDTIPPPPSTPFSCTEWLPTHSRENYAQGVQAIHEAIARGETYQVNYTFSLETAFTGDPYAGFFSIGAAQGAGYSAWLDLGTQQILFFSPELFFERRGNTLTTRPMKGTLPRGRHPAEDQQHALDLAASRKNRAENVMIVDMIRNDLGRVGLPGTVRVERLFEVERYRTLFQMTSTVRADIAPATSLASLLQALFPCASITGAPKVKTMEIIHALEPQERGLYTGAIGLIRPDGDATFNVAIRTLTADPQTGRASCHVGGGVTWDSTEQGEYDECMTKALFLTDPGYTFDLLETLLLEDGVFFLLDRHLARLKASADYFDIPLSEPALRSLLEKQRRAHPTGAWKVRLLAGAQGPMNAISEPAPPPRVFCLAMASRAISSNDRFLFHKTTRRAVYEQARADQPAADDVVLFNERGELTESTIANLVVELDGRRYTPPLSSGLLAGVFREELLQTGALCERILRREDLQNATAVYLINSVRRWIPIHLVAHT